MLKSIIPVKAVTNIKCSKLLFKFRGSEDIRWGSSTSSQVSGIINVFLAKGVQTLEVIFIFLGLVSHVPHEGTELDDQEGSF